MALPTLKGKLVNLRQPRRSDAESITLHANDHRIAKYLPVLPHPYTVADARGYINRTFRLARNDTAYFFGIEHPQTGDIIGGVGLNSINRPDRNAEVGYWIGRKFWGKGYAGEALGLMLGYSFDELRLVRIHAVVHSSNKASIRILERLHFRREGTWRKANRMNNLWHDVFSYGILKNEFRR